SGDPADPAPAPAAGPLSVSVTPRAVVRGRRTRLRVRVAGCARPGSVARVGRRAERLGEDGRGTLVALVRWRRPVALLRVATPCGTVRVPLRVRSR
ncbi:MAG TPA: hypothetical protein VF587_05925, partial [Solirubrobacteraceae bacterium]